MLHALTCGAEPCTSEELRCVNRGQRGTGQQVPAVDECFGVCIMNRVTRGYRLALEMVTREHLQVLLILLRAVPLESNVLRDMLYAAGCSPTQAARAVRLVMCRSA
jgi:hypothetical protein